MTANARLTKRAEQVAELIALGLTNREIAVRLFLSERTIEWHVEQILNKLSFSSRSQIAAWVGGGALTADRRGTSSRHDRGNLPAQLTSFVGRQSDLEKLHELIQANRLVTVVGPGGTGKTRLAVWLAGSIQGGFADGVWLCDLAPVTTPELVADAVAQALQVYRRSVDRLDAIRQHLRERSVLLVLDNCEHVLDRAAEVSTDLLAACAGLQVLATSRAPLGVIGEAIYRLEPLPLDDAIELFRSRARAAAPNFRVDDEALASITTICSRLDGIPLAIELVVPRLRVQSPKELADAVLDFSWQPQTDARQGSLEALTEWSYRLLASPERDLFSKLSVFAGWFEADAVAALLLENPGLAAKLLASLVERSMVVRDQHNGSVRYRLLEILKAFALKQLEQSGQVDAIRLAHAEHMIGLVEKGGPSADLAARRKVTSMVDDVRGALATLLALRPARALLLATGMMAAWRYGGRAAEGVAWNERALAANPEPSPQRCRSLFQQAFTLASIGRLGDAEARMGEAEAIADAPGSEDLRRETLISRANTHSIIDDFEGALRLGQEAITEFEHLESTEPFAMALNHTAMCLLYVGRHREAAEMAERALALEPHDLIRMPTMDTAAQALCLLGEHERARVYWLRAIEGGLERGWTSGIGPSLVGLALVAGLDGDSEQALRFHFVAQRLISDHGIRMADPIDAPAAEVIARVKAELGDETVARIRTECAGLEPEVLLERIRLAG